MTFRTLALMACIGTCVGALHGQEAAKPISRAEVMGRLAAGEPPSYVAHLVKLRGTAFSVTVDYLDMIRLAGGDGILVERLSTASIASSGTSYLADPPFASLAKCAQFEQIGSYDRAKQECEAAVKSDPASPWPLLAMSRCLERLMETKAAKEQANRAVQLSPELAGAHARLNASLSSVSDSEISASHLRAARLLQNEGKNEEAWAEVREAIRLEPDNPLNHSTLASMYGDDMVDASIAEFRKIVNLQPYDAEARLQLADFLEEHGDMPGAVAETLTAVNYSPSALDPHRALIDLYKTSNDTEEEIQEHKRFLRLVPDAHEDRLNLAELLWQKHQMEESAVECEELIRRIPHDTGQDYSDAQKKQWLGQAHNMLGNVLYAQEQIDEAIAEYQLAEQLLPEDGVPISNLANILAVQGRLQQAVDQYRLAQDLNFNDTNVTVALGIALARLGNLDSAKDEFDRALATDPDNDGARTSLAHVYQLKGQLGQATAEYERVLVSHPDSAVAHNNLADIYATSPDPQYRNPVAALKHAKRAVELSKMGSPRAEQATFLATLAEALGANGKSEEIVPTLRQAAAADPTSALVHRSLASALASAGDHPGAGAEYEQVVRLQPDSASAQNELAWFYATCPDARYRNPLAALQHANRAMELLDTDSPGSERAAFLDTLAEALLVNGRHQEALNAEERAVDADPNNIEIRKRVDRFREAVRLLAIP